MKELIVEINEKIFVEIPHERPPTCSILSEHQLEQAVFNGNYGDTFEGWAANNGFRRNLTEFELPDGSENPDFITWERELYANQDALIGYMGHDLHALHVFDSVEEALNWAKTYKGHQWVKATIQLKELLEEV